MRRMETAIRGEVRIELCGAQPEAALNACALQGVVVSGLESVDAYTLRLSVSEKDRESFEQIAARCLCDTRVLELRGGSKTRRLLKRRMGFLIMAALVAGLLLGSSLFIWEIDVVGCETLTKGQVLRALADCGVESGTFWPGLSTDLVRSRMLVELPELAWMTVNVSASKATVLILERAEKPEIYQEDDAADIVASQTGIVAKLSVLNGKPLVEPGQSVVAGEILVSGVMDSITNAPRTVRARAEVWADTWYEITAVCPAEMGIKTGETRTSDRFALKIGENRINFYRSSGKAIDGCDKIIKEIPLGIEGLFRFPVSLVREELLYYREETGSTEIGEELQQRLYDGLAAQIDGEICSVSFTVAEGDGLLYVTMRAQCRENIAIPSEIRP